MLRSFVCLAIGVLAFVRPVDVSSAELETGPLLQKIKEVGPKGKGHKQAIAAMEQLSKADVAQLPQVLAGMDDAGPLAANWIRAAVESIAQNATGDGKQLPTKGLEKYLADTSHSARGRRLAYELVTRADPAAKNRWVTKFLDDPSLELRREAVADAMEKAKSLAEKDKTSAVTSYRKALSSARDIDQIKEIAKAIRDQGETVDLPSHFGFVMRWNLIAPFDNTDMKGFDVVYAPEKNVDLKAKTKGKEGEVAWTSHATTDEFGNVDINKALDKHKGAICYAFTEFFADKAQDIEMRLGCINANKVWLNGRLLTANEVYHARTDIDQYIGTGPLKKGSNTILLKICQNEQEEPWAQVWKFQLRVCDQYGTAVLSQDRPSTQAASGEK
jgi:hypothetical protein